MKQIIVLLAVIVVFATIVWACPVRPFCPSHHVEMDKASSNCDDNGRCTLVYHCPVGGENYTVHCQGGE